MVDRDGNGNCQVCKLRELRARGYRLNLGPLTLDERDTPTGHVWTLRQSLYVEPPPMFRVLLG